MVPSIAVPPVMAAVATVLLFAVVVMAAWWPAHCAARTEPTVSLRAQ